MIFADQIRKQIDVMLHPRKAIKEGMSIGDAFRYYYKVGIISMIITSVIVAGLSSWPYGLGVFVELVALTPLGIIIEAALLQVIGYNLFRVFKGKFSDSLTAAVYSSSIFVLFSWLLLIPGINIVFIAIFAVWQFIVLIIGLAQVHKTTALTSFGIILVTCIILAVIVVLIGLFVVAGILLPYAHI